MTDDLLRKAIEDREAGVLCHALFGHDLTPGQESIARSIAFPRERRVIVNAMTRYGKTWSIADGISLRLTLDPDQVLARCIGPTQDQATILRGYVTDNALTSPDFSAQLDLDATGLRRLKKEVTRRKYTFKNDSELLVLSAEGKAERLMGHGGNLIVLDESCLIKPEVYQGRISRMLGDAPEDGVLLESSNPWHKAGHYYEHWNDPAFHRIHIGYEQAIQEGRTTLDFIQEQQRHLPPGMFQVLYESRFPDTIDGQLIAWDWIDEARKRAPAREGQVQYGLDVAEAGGDESVLTRVRIRDGHEYSVEKQEAWAYADTMKTAARVLHTTGKHHGVNVDETGVGKGVVDRLRDDGARVRGIKTGRSATDKDRYTNLGSQLLWHLRTLFEEGRISLHHASQDLIDDLSKWEYSIKSGRIHVEVTGGKSGGNSPDHGDSLAYACWGSVSRVAPARVKARNPLKL